MAEEKKKKEEKMKKEEKSAVEESAAEETLGLEKAEKTSSAPSEDSKSKKKKKKQKRQILKAQAHVKCTYNNTMISITDMNGGVLGWSSSGLLGFKGAKKATPYAATQVISDVYEKVRKFGIKEMEVYVRGVGSGRESSIRTLSNKGFELVMIKDTTPVPHNGCRPKKPRRV